MDMLEYIKENFTPTVTEDKDGMKVILTNGSEVVPDCIVWFEPAKRGWSKKPISGIPIYILWMLTCYPYLNSSPNTSGSVKMTTKTYDSMSSITPWTLWTNISMGKNKSPFVWWCNIYSLSLF